MLSGKKPQERGVDGGRLVELVLLSLVLEMLLERDLQPRKKIGRGLRADFRRLRPQFLHEFLDIRELLQGDW